MFDAEKSHDRTLKALQYVSKSPKLCRMMSWLYEPKTFTSLHQNIWGMDFLNPVGLAAGVDKNGVAMNAWEALGFGFMECGTVTPAQGQQGNPKPRVQRLRRDQAIVNYMGFPNNGADALGERIKERLAGRAERKHHWTPVGANISKSKDSKDDIQDFLKAYDAIRAADYVVLNVSSPNTTGLRTLQNISFLREVVDGIRDKKPGVRIFVKLSPDLDNGDLIRLAFWAVCNHVGIVATNTSINRALVTRSYMTIYGGISGRPLAPRSREVLALLRGVVRDEIPLISVGGVWNAGDVYERIKLGASLVQIYTSFVYQGPKIMKKLCVGLDALLRRDGFSNIKEAVGRC